MRTNFFSGGIRAFLACVLAVLLLLTCIPPVSAAETVWRMSGDTAILWTEPVEHLFDRALNQNYVPVIDDVDSFIGIITRRDILTLLFKKYKDNTK